MVLGPYSCTISPEPMILEKTLNLLELRFFCSNVGIKDLPPPLVLQIQQPVIVTRGASASHSRGRHFLTHKGRQGTETPRSFSPLLWGKGPSYRASLVSLRDGGLQTSLQEWRCSVGACREHCWLLPDAEAPSGCPLLSSSPPFPLQPEDSSTCLSDSAFLCPGPNFHPWRPSSVSISEGHRLTRFSHGPCSIPEHL